MTCRRWKDVAFSTEYYTAHQHFLVREDSPVHSLDDLAGRRVCVTTRSTSLDILGWLAPEAEPAPVRDRTGCLLGLLEGEVDAYFGHDSFLYGMVAQDQTVEARTELIPPQYAEDTAAHYGIAIGHDQPDLVRFVNAVLEELRADGTWAEMHSDLELAIGVPEADPPPAQYRSED
jgi:polar amino acid transport system substrate-binding protein